MPNQNIIQDLFSAVTDLAELVVPLVGAAYVLSQVTGQILKATNPEPSYPPPTYFIGIPPDHPNAPQQQAAIDEAQAVTPVVGIGIDTAGGLFVEGPNHNVLLGSNGAPVAVVGMGLVSGQPVLTGNNKILIGPNGLPLAGAGSATGWGPLVDTSPDGVQMDVHPMMQAPPGKHWLYNVPGTGGKWNQDLTAEVAGQVDGGHYQWQGVSYPAEVFPMGPSVKAGVEEMVRLISQRAGTFAIMGYSQGAVVTCKLWRDEILNPAGRLHDRLGDIFGHVSFGNPMRCPGFAHGNGWANLPPLENEFGHLTGGIAGPDDLTPWQTPWWHADFAKNGDLYATCPTGPDPWMNEAEPGEMQTGVYKMIMGEIAGHESILQQVGEILTSPFSEMVPLILAIADGIQFAANTGTHDYRDCVGAAVNFLNQRGAQTPVG